MKTTLLGIAIAAALVLTSGCATIATHYQCRADAEREARLAQARGLGATVRTSDGIRVPVDSIGAWELIAENWPAYLKSAGLDVGLAIGAYYLYRHRNDGDDGENVVNNYYAAPDASGADAEEEDADDGGEE